MSSRQEQYCSLGRKTRRTSRTREQEYGNGVQSCENESPALDSMRNYVKIKIGNSELKHVKDCIYLGGINSE
jgi:hypothetical protein